MDKPIDFARQTLMVSNDRWEVRLCYEDENAEHAAAARRCDKAIDLSGCGYPGAQLSIEASDPTGNNRCLLITGIDGGVYLHAFDEKSKCQSVKLTGDMLVLSMGFTFLAVDIAAREICWQLRPERTEIFEFYDLEGDYLLRGEQDICRIDRQGNIIWRFGGRDIWVNIDGKEEVQITADKIILTDFANNTYYIDFNGRRLS